MPQARPTDPDARRPRRARAGAALGVLRKPHYLFRPERGLRRAAQRLSHREARPCEVRLPWGARIRVDPGEDIGRAIWSTGVYDLAVSEALWRLTDPGDRAADVGANIGYFSALLASRCHPGGLVVAFEPHPDIFGELRANAARWARQPGMAAIDQRRVALSRSTGTGALFTGDFTRNRGLSSLEPSRDEGGGASLAVTVDRFDAQWPGAGPDVVKLDVEGHEQAVLDGAGAALRRVRDLVFEDFAPQPSPLRQTLEDAGFTVFGLSAGVIGPRLARGAVPAATGYTPPNYLATRRPERAAERFHRPGWQVLSYRAGGRRRC